jgi:SAM-dependent methyltransferase
VKLVRLDPPGSWCQAAAVLDCLGRTGNDRLVVDVGCGGGSLLEALCNAGFRGVGIDTSPEALAVARDTLRRHLATGRCALFEGDVAQWSELGPPADAAVSMMTLEHVEDDTEFLEQMASIVRPGGSVLVVVPGRLDRWSFEDEVAGHLRRYERTGLAARMRASGLLEVEVRSVSVPVANLLFDASQWLVRRATPAHIRNQSRAEQTAASGIRGIPFKTLFPSWCRWLLNGRTMAPWFWLQRRFYDTDLGITLLGVGATPASRGD